MRILGRYVFREILSSSLLATVLAIFVIFLQGSRSLFELLIRSSAKPETVLYLVALSMPPLLPLAIPFGALVGILVGLGRMSSDGEITAMRAAGIPSRRLIMPVLTLALLGTALAGLASIRLIPLAARRWTEVVTKLAATQLTAEIQPRVFAEQFPKTILYVGDVRPTQGQNVTIWRNVFMADVTPPDQRHTGLGGTAEGPLITVAREALAVTDPEHNRIQVSLRDASTHEIDKDGKATDTFFPRGEQALEASPPSAQISTPPFREMNTGELRKHAASGPDWLEARIELHRRLALPLACFALALVGIPLGISSRKGGKSSGYVTAVFLAFFCYWLGFMSLTGVAKQRALPVEVAAWLPNLVFAIAGLILIARLEMPGEHDLLGGVRSGFVAVFERIKSRLQQRGAVAPRAVPIRLPLLPQLLDTYILNQFLFFFALLLGSFVAMTEVFNFFDLLGDIVKNKIPLAKVFVYLFFLTPKLIYDLLPISVLVAILVTFGVLTKQNEVTAFKACGVSLRRLSMPLVIASVLLSAGLFAFDYSYVPDANRKQEALRNEIKNRAVQTYLRPDRKWIFGTGSRIYYYRYFDRGDTTGESVMAGVSVYELDPATFRLVRQISAERAYWRPSMRTWVFENGWRRDIDNKRQSTFERYQAATFPELNEPPEHFLRELKQDKQMNFHELEEYIRGLQQSGFDTVKLQVQFYRKFAVPLFVPIMALIAIPFGFLVGNRGAMAGIGVSIAIAIAYLGIGQVFEQIGNVNLLPASLAAWAPDALFSLTGLYLMLRMRT